MEKIISKDNKIIKLAKKLDLKKYRDKYNKYKIEGPNIVREALKCNMEIEIVLWKESHFEKNFPGENQEIFQNLQNFNIKQKVVSDDLFLEISDTETSQGIIAIVNKTMYNDEEDFFKGVENANFIVIDRLQDLGNIGTIIRTADAAGFYGAIILKGSGDVYASKTVRAATGSLFRLPIYFIENNEELILLCKKYKKRLVCADIEESLPYNEAPISENITLVIGNEGNGVSKELIDRSDVKIYIPMEGNIESLNAAVAAGIVMYEIKRQRKE